YFYWPLLLMSLKKSRNRTDALDNGNDPESSPRSDIGLWFSAPGSDGIRPARRGLAAVRPAPHPCDFESMPVSLTGSVCRCIRRRRVPMPGNERDLMITRTTRRSFIGVL